MCVCVCVCVCVAGVFALLQAYAFLQYLKDRLTRQEFQTLFFLGVSLAAGAVFLTVIYLTYTGECTHHTHLTQIREALIQHTRLGVDHIYYTVLPLYGRKRPYPTTSILKSTALALLSTPVATLHLLQHHLHKRLHLCSEPQPLSRSHPAVFFLPVLSPPFITHLFGTAHAGPARSH